MTQIGFSVKAATIADKWVLSSAVQKLIRRGRADQAIELALRLEKVSPGYLRRRLPVIALEEVGAADAQKCLAVARICSDGLRWAIPTAAIVEAVGTLADAVKSRAACDAACLSEADPAVLAARASIQLLPREDLLRIALDAEWQWSSRCAALDLACVTKGTPRHWAAVQLARVAEAFGLPYEARALMATHRHDVRSMAVMLPLAFEALALPSKLVDASGLPGSSESVRGVPLCAVDMYSRAGRVALAQFCRDSPEIRRFRASCEAPATLQRAVAFAVFHLDSCHLRQQIVTTSSEALREGIEALELAQLGISPEERPHLFAAISNDAHILNRSRERVLRELP